MDVRNVAAGSTGILLRETGEGDGVPVLLLHGVPETSTVWRDVAPALADDRRVLAPDLPGLGGSSYGGPFDVPSVAAQVAALVEKEAPGGRVDLVGHDWGGMVALGLAAHHPDLVRRLVVSHAVYRKASPRAVHAPLLALPVLPELAFRVAGKQLVEGMLRLGWKAPTPLADDARAEYVAAYTDRDAVRAMLGYYRAAVRPKVLGAVRRGEPPSYPRIQVEKALVLWGAADPVLPISVGESIVKDLGPQTVMVTVPGAGHFVIEEATDVVVGALRDFLS